MAWNPLLFGLTVTVLVAEGSPTVRLVNGPNNCSGRVEVFHDGQWGTVCDDRWDLTDASVVCSQLDCGKAVSAPSSALFGRGTGRIWLDDVNCVGNEASVTECEHRGFGNNNCGHSEDAGVVCEGVRSEAIACGTVPAHTRAPGADADAPGNWPWLVTLNNGSHDFCSGSLISRDLVLTSAHCIFSRHRVGAIVAKMGYNQSVPSPDEVSRRVFDGTCGAYNASTGENDICLLHLSSPVTVTDTVRPICLAGNTSVFHTGQSSWVSHRSEMEDEEGNNTSRALQEVKLTVVGNNECRCTHGSSVTENNTVCAEPGADEDHDIHEGDFGGPLIAQLEMSWIQFGIVSFGSGWANAATPRGYTRVSEYQDWIRRYRMDRNADPPTFVSFNMGGDDSDLNFTCSTHEPTTHEPPTHEPPTHKPPTLEPTTHEPPTHEPPTYQPPTHQPPTNQPPTHEPPTHEPPTLEPPTYQPPTHQPPTHQPLTDDRCGGSIFDSGERAISSSHFTHLAAMCSLALYLWVFG